MCFGAAGGWVLAAVERQVDAAQRPLVEMEDESEDHAVDEHAGQGLRDVEVRDPRFRDDRCRQQGSLS